MSYYSYFSNEMFIGLHTQQQKKDKIKQFSSKAR